jgi:hypothetical protein
MVTYGLEKVAGSRATITANYRQVCAKYARQTNDGQQVSESRCWVSVECMLPAKTDLIDLSVHESHLVNPFHPIIL